MSDTTKARAKKMESSDLNRRFDPYQIITVGWGHKLVGPGMTTVTITLPPPHPHLSPNARPHWAAKAARVKSYRATAWTLARAATAALAACQVPPGDG